MKYRIITFSSLPVAGIALFPFILVDRKSYKADKTLINHEKIHLRQQLEMLIVPFYIAYLLNYLVNLLKYRNHDASYRNIVFEKEAFEMDKDADYLKNRRFWAWLRYIKG